MARLKFAEIKKMSKSERDKKLLEIRLELMKARANVSKGGSAKVKEARRTIARIFTLDSLKESNEKPGNVVSKKIVKTEKNKKN